MLITQKRKSKLEGKRTVGKEMSYYVQSLSYYVAGAFTVWPEPRPTNEETNSELCPQWQLQSLIRPRYFYVSHCSPI